ncbi:MAG: hypothetical protein R3D86_12800 [Emcibacteraceae bacterium]
MHSYLRTTAPLEDEVKMRGEGMIKLRLGHSQVGTVIIPDVVFINDGRKVRYFSPSFFSACNVAFDIEEGVHLARLTIDFASPHETSGTRVLVVICSTDRVRCYDDGAQLYKCIIECDQNISDFSAGDAVVRDEDFSLILFHHSTPDAIKSITRSKELWSSAWNLQGTRRLKNIAYVYFTSLSKIDDINDLERIAMSSQGQITLTTTSPDQAEEITTVNVYRESTEGRTAKLKVQVGVELLSPPHLRLHIPRRPNTPYYEIVQPEVFRVGLLPKAKLSLKKVFFNKYLATVDNRLMAGFDNIIMGHASTIEGLKAPYDEENTDYLMHLERLNLENDLFDFWKSHKNTDQVSNRNPEKRELDPLE